MSEVKAWSTSASNNNAAPPDGWPENTMAFGQINNTAREMMAAIARWYVDTSGILMATGLHFHAPVNAWGYHLTMNRQISSLELDMRVRFRIPTPNIGPTWLLLNGIGPFWILWPDGGMMQASDLADVVDVYWHGGGNWILDNLPRRRLGEFTAGTTMLFYAASAPTYWTQVTSLNDRLVRVVSGTGTGLGGSWTITGLSNETANHTHSASVSGGTSTANLPSAGGFEFGAAASAAAPGGHSHSFALSFTTAGTSNPHTHAHNGTPHVPWVDHILCRKA